VRVKTDEVNAAQGQKAMALQTELSGFIGTNIQELMKQGFKIMDIQDAIRAATEDIVEQTYAPDKTECEQSEYDILEPPLDVNTYYLPMDKSIITNFISGNLDSAGLTDKILTSPDITTVEMVEILDLVLTDFGKNPSFSDVLEGGEIIAGPDGEAFLFEYLEIKDSNECCHAICEPAVFKSFDEICAINATLESVTEKVFFKKADIKKLIKTGCLDEYNRRSIKKEADYIKSELWKEFINLREIYNKAKQQENGILIFTGYNEAHEE